MNIINFLLLNLLLITSSFSQDQNYDEELNCDQFTELSFEIDQEEEFLTVYAYTPGIDNPIAMVRDHNGNGRFEDNEVFYFTKDHLGSIRELTDKDGNVIQRYRYSSYGETTIEKANPSTQHKIIENRYAFTSRELELETGFYDYRPRVYNPVTHSFLSSDPIEFLSGDNNFYRYVENSPVMLNDPSGLANKSDVATGGGTWGGMGGGGGGGSCVKAFNSNQRAVIDLAKQAQRRGLTPDEGKILREWATEYKIPNRGPEAHPGDGFGSNPHYHIGPIPHIPMRK